MSSLWAEFVQDSSKYTDNTTLQELNYAVNISLKNKYIFIETPKVACSTIKLTLQRFELESVDFKRVNFEDIHDRSYSPLLSLQQTPDFESILHSSEYFRFCFVRNPYARTLSAYLDKIKFNPGPQKIKILRELGYDEKYIDKDITFDNFLSVIENQKPLEMDNHWRHQYFTTYQDSIKYDFYGRFESFADDFSFVLGKIGGSAYYQRESRHETKSHSLMSKYYNDELMERVYNLFIKDFEAFNYEIDRFV